MPADAERAIDLNGNRCAQERQGSISGASSSLMQRLKPAAGRLSSRAVRGPAGLLAPGASASVLVR